MIISKSEHFYESRIFTSFLVWQVQECVNDTIFPGVDVSANSPQFNTVQQTAKDLRAASLTLQALVSMLNIKVHGSTIKKD